VLSKIGLHQPEVKLPNVISVRFEVLHARDEKFFAATRKSSSLFGRKFWMHPKKHNMLIVRVQWRLQVRNQCGFGIIKSKLFSGKTHAANDNNSWM